MKLKYFIFICGGLFLLCTLCFYHKPSTPLPETCIITRLEVVKHKRTLHAYSNDSIVKSYDISLGRQPEGAKEFEGDMKTPEGSYTIFDKNPNSNYHKNLGISYPNTEEVNNARKLGKPAGGLIKIHGIKNGIGWLGRFHLLSNWTLGCIAVTDDEIDELYKYVQVGTPIDILP